MSDNSKKMTLEEKLVQTVKDETLFKLVGDEDAITELVTRAVHEALIQPQRIRRTDSYNGRESYETKDSVLIETCREMARTQAKLAAEKIAAEALERDDVKDAIFNAMIAAIPAALGTFLNSQMHVVYNNATNHTINRIQDLRRSGMPGI